MIGARAPRKEVCEFSHGAGVMNDSNEACAREASVVKADSTDAEAAG